MCALFTYFIVNYHLQYNIYTVNNLKYEFIREENVGESWITCNKLRNQGREKLVTVRIRLQLHFVKKRNTTGLNLLHGLI